MEDKIILYGSHLSTCTNTVKAFFNVSGISYEFKTADLFAETESFPKDSPACWQRLSFKRKYGHL